MKNYLLLFSLCLLICSCKDKTETKTETDTSTTLTANEAAVKESNKGGVFKAVTSNKTYEVAIECSYYEEDYFQFKSDKLDVGDSNGDGLNINGFQTGKQLVLTIVDNGVKFSAPNITTWQKTDNAFKGTATLYEEGSSTANTIEVTFSGSCN